VKQSIALGSANTQQLPQLLRLPAGPVEGRGDASSCSPGWKPQHYPHLAVAFFRPAVGEPCSSAFDFSYSYSTIIETRGTRFPPISVSKVSGSRFAG